ncbi:MAG: helix-turn-helix transcriptional regulator [Candidatus Sumerlaeota bacterium]|nr:helix-turn-helix transcriptional regulator [Candidatus Sumerlaeota bacterium]
MRFSGRVFKAGRYWAIEVPILGVASQGHSKKDAYLMIADAIEALVNKTAFRIEVFPGKGDYFEISANDQAILTAFLLRRERTRSGLSLADVAKHLGARSLNAYARYEQGRSVPTISKLTALLAAVAPKKDFVLAESRA